MLDKETNTAAELQIEWNSEDSQDKESIIEVFIFLFKEKVIRERLYEIKEFKSLYNLNIKEISIRIINNTYHVKVLSEEGNLIDMKRTNGNTHRCYIFLLNYTKELKRQLESVNVNSLDLKLVLSNNI